MIIYGSYKKHYLSKKEGEGNQEYKRVDEGGWGVINCNFSIMGKEDRVICVLFRNKLITLWQSVRCIIK